MTVEQLLAKLGDAVRQDARFARARVVLTVGRHREVPVTYVHAFTDVATSQRVVELQ